MDDIFQILEQMEIKKVPETLNRIYSEYHNAFKYFKEKYNWDENRDFRIAFLKTFAEGIHQSLLSGLFLKENLSKIKWWEEHFNIRKEDSSHIIESKLTNFDQVIKESLLQKIFIEFEAFVKEIHFYLTKQQYITRSIDTSSVFNDIIRECNLPIDYSAFFRILLNIKHVIFNGGIFLEDDQDITFRNRKYLFTKGYALPVEYVSWENIEYYFLEIKNFLLEVIDSEKIMAAEIIESPSTTVNYLQGQEIYKTDPLIIERSLASLKAFNLNSLKNDVEIRSAIEKFGIIPYFIVTLNPGKQIFRARPNNGDFFQKLKTCRMFPLNLIKPTKELLPQQIPCSMEQFQ